MDLTYESEKNELNELFNRYLKEMKYLRNFSERTITTYQYTKLRWDKYAGGMPTAEKLDQFIIGMRENGLKATTCNVSVRAFNAFLTWLKGQGKVGDIRLKKLPIEKRQMRVFSDEDVKKVLAFKPKTKNERRIYTVFCTILDTGLRISECLSIEVSRVNFDTLTISVKGKGKKERIVPISLELRKVLFIYLTKFRASNPNCVYLFCTGNGTRLTYRNAYRDLESILVRTGVGKEGIDGFFHSLRRKFARSYIKNGGNVLYLQRAMGHADLTTTQLYVSPDDEDIQRVHLYVSPLGNLKRL
jgi:integrase/recombinase XerD